jgi:hypothetical protein
MDIPDAEMKSIRSVSETYANCWLTRSAAVSRRTDACRKPARPARPAIAMATLPAIAASALPGPSLRRSHWKPAKPTGSPICTPSQAWR